MTEGRLGGKIAIVTGAARGQGEGVARLFAAEGARVALFDVLDGEGERVAAEIRGEQGAGEAAKGQGKDGVSQIDFGSRRPSEREPRSSERARGKNRNDRARGQDRTTCRYWHCDVTDEAQIRATVTAVVDTWGGLDILYNNAAIISYGRKIADLDAAEWDRTIAVNLRGPFLCAKHALPHLVRRGGGVIINVSSHGAFRAAPVGIADYAVSKGGLVTLTYYLASEYGPDHVRANCIAPGPVPTDLTNLFLGTPEGRALAAQMIPLGQVGEIDDVARAALFLASDDARWISGAVLRVDGGIVVQ